MALMTKPEVEIDIEAPEEDEGGETAEEMGALIREAIDSGDDKALYLAICNAVAHHKEHGDEEEAPPSERRERAAAKEEEEELAARKERRHVESSHEEQHHHPSAAARELRHVGVAVGPVRDESARVRLGGFERAGAL